MTTATTDLDDPHRRLHPRPGAQPGGVRRPPRHGDQSAGPFKEFEGVLHLDAEDPTRSSADVTLQVASIDSGNPDRDAHLRSADFFDVEAYPTITLQEHQGRDEGRAHRYRLTGDLTIRGVTRPVTIDIEFTGATNDPWGQFRRIGFEGSVTSTAATGTSAGTWPSTPAACSCPRRSRSSSTSPPSARWRTERTSALRAPGWPRRPGRRGTAGLTPSPRTGGPRPRRSRRRPRRGTVRSGRPGAGDRQEGGGLHLDRDAALGPPPLDPGRSLPVRGVGRPGLPDGVRHAAALEHRDRRRTRPGSAATSRAAGR